MPAAPPRSAPARGGAAPARGGATAEARGAAPARPAAAGGGGGCFTKMCPNGKLKNDGKQTGIGCCIIGYAIFCSLAAFTRVRPRAIFRPMRPMRAQPRSVCPPVAASNARRQPRRSRPSR